MNVDLSRVRRSGSRQLPINSEVAPPLPTTVFFLAVSQPLSKSICADCTKASIPVSLAALLFQESSTFILLLTLSPPVVKSPQIMTAYSFPHAQTLSPDVAARRAARKKVIARAQRIERESYKALMRKKRQLHACSDLATIA